MEAKKSLKLPAGNEGRSLAPLLDNHRPRIEAAFALILSLPGSPVLYYGDEIGMGDLTQLGDRDGIRTPMQWSGGIIAAFAGPAVSHLVLPLITDPAYSYLLVNVEAEEANPDSLLVRLRRMIAARQRYRAFGRGDIEFIDGGNPAVLAFLRRLASHELILVVVNLSNTPQSAQLPLPADARHRSATEIRGRTKFPSTGDDAYPVTLGPCGYYWLDLTAI